MNRLRKAVAWLIGKEVVCLTDFDGEVLYRMATQTPFGLTCSRWGLFGKTDCLLRDDGTVVGPSYVCAWRTP